MPRSKHRNVKRHCRLDIRKLCTSLLFPFAFEDEKATTVPAATRYASHVLPLETSIHEVLKRFHDAQLIPRMVIEWRMGKGPVNGVTCNGSIHDGYTCVLVHTPGEMKRKGTDRLWLVSSFARIANFQLWTSRVSDRILSSRQSVIRLHIWPFCRVKRKKDKGEKYCARYRNYEDR